MLRSARQVIIIQNITGVVSEISQPSETPEIRGKFMILKGKGVCHIAVI